MSAVVDDLNLRNTYTSDCDRFDVRHDHYFRLATEVLLPYRVSLRSFWERVLMPSCLEDENISYTPFRLGRSLIHEFSRVSLIKQNMWVSARHTYLALHFPQLQPAALGCPPRSYKADPAFDTSNHFSRLRTFLAPACGRHPLHWQRSYPAHRCNRHRRPRHDR